MSTGKIGKSPSSPISIGISTRGGQINASLFHNGNVGMLPFESPDDSETAVESEIQHFLLDRNQYVQEKTVSTGLSAEEMIAKLIDDLVLLAKKHVMASNYPAENLQFVVLVCVPDDISPAKRQMIMTAGEIAGFTGSNLRLINESTATAINHLYDEFSIGRLNCEQQEKVHQGSSGVERSQSSSVSGFAAKGGRIKCLCVILSKESQHHQERIQQRQFVVTFFKLKPNIQTAKTLTLQSGAAGKKLFEWQMELIESFSVVDNDDLKRMGKLLASINYRLEMIVRFLDHKN